MLLLLFTLLLAENCEEAICLSGVSATSASEGYACLLAFN
jgi:hypothetical protein